jgi:hypothetical protein
MSLAWVTYAVMVMHKNGTRLCATAACSWPVVLLAVTCHVQGSMCAQQLEPLLGAILLLLLNWVRATPGRLFMSSKSSSQTRLIGHWLV